MKPKINEKLDVKWAGQAVISLITKRRTDGEGHRAGITIPVRVLEDAGFDFPKLPDAVNYVQKSFVADVSVNRDNGHVADPEEARVLKDLLLGTKNLVRVFREMTRTGRPLAEIAADFGRAEPEFMGRIFRAVKITEEREA